MDFRFSTEEEAFQREVRDFVLAEVPQELRWSERVAFTDALWPSILEARKRLTLKGWTTMHWPAEYGGQGASHITHMLLVEELAYWGIPQAIAFDDGPNIIGPTIIRFGSDHLKRTLLPPIARAETFWCQGYTEPGSGSDLAAVRTTAAQDGDHYVINGQKDFISGAARADWIHVLTRTNSDAPRYHNLTYFVVDMGSPGITLRPLDEAHGRSGMLNEIFFDNVRVPIENLIGERDGGWQVAMSTLNLERAGIENVGRARGFLEDTVKYARETLRYGKPLFNVTHIRSKLAEMAVKIEACRLAAYRVAWLRDQGLDPVYESSMSKLLSSEMWQYLTNVTFQVSGLYGPLKPGSKRAPIKGRISEEYIGSTLETIYEGTSEIQRNIIAQRGLGLPRS
ncbi:MAG: acyl-CoA dehydrogenase family protein [Dehalococcoidia bacterium]|nr:acyl-CoA dehydrogenase family protein [Dehalococcoidia bacterium]